MKERELLERAFEALEFWHPSLEPEADPLLNDIREYLAQPEQKREALSKEEILKRWDVAVRNGHIDRATFIYGIRFAERHHGIGGEE